MSIQELTPKALRQFMQTQRENHYRLVDVRQPGEYEQSHIPGALLLPLPELVQSLSALPLDKSLVFYCRSGGRSLAAASMVEDEQITGSAIYNLAGGMLAWDGAEATDRPRIGLFDLQAQPADLLMQAMNLEKGAMNFYAHVRQQYTNEEWSEVFARLSKAEIGHARTVFHFWKRITPQRTAFDTVFEALQGDVLEGGDSFEQAVDRVSAMQGKSCMPLIELALHIEYAAFDLYRTMAGRSPSPDAREAFLTIAQSEKAHMRYLIRAIGGCR